MSGVHELVYLHPFTDARTKETDPESYRFVADGVLIRLTLNTVMFVPLHRICSLSLPVNDAVALWGVGSRWKRAAKEASKVQT